jgi:hypothetical protein
MLTLKAILKNGGGCRRMGSVLEYWMNSGNQRFTLNEGVDACKHEREKLR